MRLLLDEDTQAKTLVRLLREAGHDVLTAEAAGLNTMADSEVLAHALRERRVLLTRNCGDFLAHHGKGTAHWGILGIYQGSDPAKNMSYHDITRAVGNLESSGTQVEGAFLVLNAWRWER